jgi:transposase
MKHPRRLIRFVDKSRALLTIRAMNENARALGKLGKGKPKKLTEAQRKASADRMRQVQKLRWKEKARQEQAQ